MKIYLFAVISIALTSACSTGLKKNAIAIRLFQGPPDTSCKYITDVTGTQSMAWSYEGNVESAKNSLKNKAADKKGNFVKVIYHSSDALKTSLTGQVYQCDPTASMPPDSNDYSVDSATLNSQMKAFSESGNQISEAMAAKYRTPAETYRPTKQMDYTCQDRCLKAGYSFGLCNSRCEY